MGMQDRDYWREWQKERDKHQSQDPRYDPKPFRRSNAPPPNAPPDLVGSNWPWPYQLAVLALLFLAVFGLYKLVEPASKNPPPPPSITPSVNYSGTPSAPPVNPPRVLPGYRPDPGPGQDSELEQQKARARQARWNSFYQPSPFCRENPATTDCANDFIRARRAFEAVHGQLTRSQ